MRLTGILCGGPVILLSCFSEGKEDAMGSSDSKLNFRKAVIQLTTKTQVGRRFLLAQQCGSNVLAISASGSSITEEMRKRV